MFVVRRRCANLATPIGALGVTSRRQRSEIDARVPRWRCRSTPSRACSSSADQMDSDNAAAHVQVMPSEKVSLSWLCPRRPPVAAFSGDVADREGGGMLLPRSPSAWVGMTVIDALGLPADGVSPGLSVRRLWDLLIRGSRP